MMIVFKTFFGPKMKRTAANFQESSVCMLIAPSMLAILVVAIFFFAYILYQIILKLAVQSIYPAASKVDIGNITYWHGFNTEIKMTIALIILGILLYICRDYFSKVFILFPSSLSLDNLYSHTLIFMDSTAKEIGRAHV